MAYIVPLAILLPMAPLLASLADLNRVFGMDTAAATLGLGGGFGAFGGLLPYVLGYMLALGTIAIVSCIGLLRGKRWGAYIALITAALQGWSGISGLSTETGSSGDYLNLMASVIVVLVVVLLSSGRIDRP